MWLFVLIYTFVFLACLIYMLPLERPENFWTRFLGCVAVLLPIGGSLLVTIMSDYTNAIPYDVFWVLRPLLALGVMLLTIRISLGPQGAEVIYCGIWAYLTREFCFDFSQIIVSFLTPRAGINGDSAILINLINLMCYSLVFLGAFLLIARNLPIEQHYAGGRNLVRVPLLLTALVTAVKPIALLVDREGIQYNVFIFVQVICTFFVMAALCVQRMEEKHLTTERELEMQHLLWRQHEKQMEEARQKTELLNYKYHDLKHYIAAIRSQLGGEQGIAALDSLERSVRAFDCTVQTGNEVLDTVLTEKKLLCERESITMTCVADGALLQQMDTVDVYAIFGNAIDNAVECVSAMNDPEQKVIAISVFQVNNMVKIQIENYYSGTLTFEEGLPVTTKENRTYHGYGLKSIRNMAENYGGYLAVETKNGLFILHILLPADRLAEDRITDYEEKTTS